MREFQPEELLAFLRGLDAELSQPVRLVLIGGAAMALGYGVERGTLDIDTFMNIESIRGQLDRTREQTGLSVHVEFAAVADAPLDYEDRLVPIDLGKVQWLQVLVPERHDLALMKLMRGDQADLDAISLMHAGHPLDPDTLVARFRDEMGHAMGNPRRMELNLLVCVERLFGEMTVERAQKMLRG